GGLASLDPARETCAVCRAYVSAAYETLLAVSPADGRELTGLLARSWASDDALTTFTFELDPDARFSDGSPVEADDVVWSWERALAADGPAASLLTGLASLDAPGPH